METAENLLKQALYRPVGETALMVSFGSEISPEALRCTRALAAQLETHPFPGMREIETSYTGVTIFYDPLVLSRKSHLAEDTRLSKGYREAKLRVEFLVDHIAFSEETDGKTVRIPVCYGGEYGPDLDEVAAYHQMTAEEVVKIHTGGKYLVYMIGFAPGFPYVGGLPEVIATPRRSSPRLVIPQGSVGIAGKQTGIYPLETPGGWQLIGRTPLRLFQPENLKSPSLLEAGDHIEFYAVTPEEYKKLEAEGGSGK
jgi:inhibitor of KinA